VDSPTSSPECTEGSIAGSTGVGGCDSSFETIFRVLLAFDFRTLVVVALVFFEILLARDRCATGSGGGKPSISEVGLSSIFAAARRHVTMGMGLQIEGLGLGTWDLGLES
jgi:hypothetical protein